MKKDALQKSSTVDGMLKRAEEENKELHRAVKKLKEELRTANEDGKRAGRMVEGLKKQVEELRLEIRVRPPLGAAPPLAPSPTCAVAHAQRPRTAVRVWRHRMCKRRHSARSSGS